MVKIVGHRGARNLWPESSLSGFRKTATLGVDGVEFDVRFTRDGGMVVTRDRPLERTTEGEGRVRLAPARSAVLSPDRGPTDRAGRWRSWAAAA